ncbi:MAG TPA: GNAT family N-acetyltransferase [Planctomycetota bacterium]|nr:GNAT family N-acetyltransferase [Planctomycetota bacterium]HRR78838.1 GNAT family N-acetyltransferase [Planctomycetota bacterium]HRT92856.1 GNAT family N-acetyltransferase [Planctomycetota bacterium]
MRVRAITTEADWQRLEPEWDPLVERAASATVFLTWEWLVPWWRHFAAKGDELAILAAREGDTLVGLAPLYRSRVAAAHRLGSLRRLGVVGDRSGDSEYLDFAIAPGREADVLPAFLDAIERDERGWDLLHLHLMPAASPNLAPLRRLAAERGWLVESKSVPCLAIRLPGAWEQYLATLQPRFRSKLRSLERRFGADDAAAFEMCADAAALPERLESLFALHQRRWRAAGKPGAFADAARRGFYRDMGEAFLRRGWLRLWSLRLGGRFVAHEFSFEHLGRVYFLQQAYDLACSDQNVGTALKAHVIRQSIAGGARAYDFLAGAAPYKQRWGAAASECVQLTFGRPAARARLHLGLRRLAERARNRGRALTPAPVLKLKRKAQEWLRERRLPPDEGG